jgi:hypothetical protein
MFKWMKNLFVTAEDVAIPTHKLSEVAPQPVTIKKEVEKVEAAVSKKVVKKVEELELTPSWPFPTAQQQEKIAVEKVTKASLSKLTKQGLEDFALATYGVDIDRRKKKEELVKEVLKLSKKA